MREDVQPAFGDPWNKVFGNSFLVPSPLLAALPALQAVLRHGNDISCEEQAGYNGPAFSLPADERFRKIMFFPFGNCYESVFSGRSFPGNPQRVQDIRQSFFLKKGDPCTFMKKNLSPMLFSDLR
jgi:hypothetical protein